MPQTQQLPRDVSRRISDQLYDSGIHGSMQPELLRLVNKIVFKELESAQKEAVSSERIRLLNIVKKTPISSWDTDGTRVANELLKDLMKEYAEPLPTSETKGQNV